MLPIRHYIDSSDLVNKEISDRVGHIRWAAKHMIHFYSGLKYTSQQRAVDYAFNYVQDQWQHQWWLDVSHEIQRREIENSTKQFKRIKS